MSDRLFFGTGWDKLRPSEAAMVAISFTKVATESMVAFKHNEGGQAMFVLRGPSVIFTKMVGEITTKA